MSEQAPDLDQIKMSSSNKEKACKDVLSIGASRRLGSMDVPEVPGLFKIHLETQASIYEIS